MEIKEFNGEFWIKLDNVLKMIEDLRKYNDKGYYPVVGYLICKKMKVKEVN